MTRAARVYDFTIPASGAITILAEGSFYRLMTAAGALEVRRNNGSIVGPLLPGQGERAEFLSLTLSDKSGASNAGSILIGDDTFIDDRITGEVAVIDGGYALTAVDRAFCGAVTCGPVAGQYSHAQLWNPAGSGVRLAVSAIVLSSYSGTTTFELRSAVASIATLVNAVPNKRIGGAASIGELRTEQNAAVIGSAALFQRIIAAGSVAVFINANCPYILEPGTGIVAMPASVNFSILANFEFTQAQL